MFPINVMFAEKLRMGLTPAAEPGLANITNK